MYVKIALARYPASPRAVLLFGGTEIPGWVLIVAAVMTLAVGCSKSRSLAGTWTMNVDKTMAELEKADAFKRMPDAQKKMAEDEAKKSLASISVTYTDSKRTTSINGNSAGDANYKVVSSEGDKMTIETTDPKAKKPETAVVTFLDEDNVSMSSGEQTVYLTRKK